MTMKKKTFSFSNFCFLFLLNIIAGFLTKTFQLDDKMIKMNCWDTAGQDRFHSLAVSALTFLYLDSRN